MHRIDDNIQQEGFYIAPHFFTGGYIDEIIEQLEKHNTLAFDKRMPSDFNLLNSVSAVKSLAYCTPLTSLVKQVVGSNSFPINAFVLDKTQNNNWELDWHQDLKIAVKRKIETKGYHNWTIESGIPHAIAPVEVLEKRLYVRIHLDDCTKDNGALLVVPKSHKNGIVLNKADFEKIISRNAVCPEVEKGGVMFLTSLLLHKSPYSTNNKKRRVMQIAYGGTNLSNGLEWYN